VCWGFLFSFEGGGKQNKFPQICTELSTLNYLFYTCMQRSATTHRTGVPRYFFYEELLFKFIIFLSTKQPNPTCGYFAVIARFYFIHNSLLGLIRNIIQSITPKNPKNRIRKTMSLNDQLIALTWFPLLSIVSNETKNNETRMYPLKSPKVNSHNNLLFLII